MSNVSRGVRPGLVRSRKAGLLMRRLDDALDENEPIGSKSDNDTTDLIPLNFDFVGLVGRSQEMSVLTEAFDRIRLPEAPLEMLVVHGESGSGKSALIKGLEDKVERQRGFFAYGKFSQLEDTAQPYSAIVEAITELCYLIQASEELRATRSRINEAVGEEVHVLTHLIPAIELVSGGSRRLPGDRPDRRNDFAFKRFLTLLRSFLRTVCDSKHAVVLVLEDLQWADDASRQLISYIASDTQSKNVLLIGSVRDGDQRTFEIQEHDGIESQLNVSYLKLGPLSEESVNEIVAKVTELRLEHTRDLASIVFRKTGGNAYFVIQYLEMLHREKLLAFSLRTSRWEWDLKAVTARTNVSENVVGILRGKISRMSVNVQCVLMMGACLGFSFDKAVLEKIARMEHLLQVPSSDAAVPAIPEQASVPRESTFSPEDAWTTRYHKVLQKATQAGLIERLSDNKYKFSHDCVQQSAFSFLPGGEEGELLHLRLGEIILEMSRSENAEDWMLFAAVDLLTKYSTRFVQERCSNAEELARLCLEAARQSSDKCAYLPAAKYADNGLAVLDSNAGWESHYDLCLELCTVSAEMHQSYGNFDRSNESVCKVLTRARYLQDKFRAYAVHVAILGAQRDMMGAIREGTAVLKELGVRLTSRPNMLHVFVGLVTTKRLLRGRTARELRDLPRMNDTHMTEAMRLLNSMSLFSWHSGDKATVMYLTLRMMKLTLKYGLCKYSPHAFATYGILMCDLGELEEGFEYGLLALGLVKKAEFRESYARTILVVHVFLHHLKMPVYESIGPLLRGYKVGMEFGDVDFAAHCLRVHGVLSVIVGMPLENLEKQMLGYCDFFREYGQETCFMDLLPWLQLASNLMGKSDDPLVLAGSCFNEDEMAAYRTMSENPSAMVNAGYARIILLYVFGELELVEIERKKLSQRDFVSTHFMKCFIVFISGLTCFGLARRKNSMRHKLQARTYLNVIKKYVKHESVNCVPMLKLLEAEEHAVNDRSGAVAKDYDNAISMAARCGFRLMKAIASERAGEYLLLCGNEMMATDYLQRAWADYRDYGAEGKLSQMKRKYGNIVKFDERGARLTHRRSTASQNLKPHFLTQWKQPEKAISKSKRIIDF